MQIYKQDTHQITLNGDTFTADADGIIDVPDNKITAAVWEAGFVHAKGRLAQLARQAAAAEAEPSLAKAGEPEPKPGTKTTASKPSLENK